MSVMTRGVDVYRRTEAQSASPLQLVVMLYDGAVRFLNEAGAAEARGDLRARAQALTRVSAIVAECHGTLDLERGGSVARELDGLYSYISARLLDVTVKRDAGAIAEVHKLMSTLRDAWAEAAVQTVAVAGPPRHEATAGATAAR